MSVVGVGIDAAETRRVLRTFERHPETAGAVLTDSERDRAGSVSGFAALAFAAKEAAFKALGESWTAGRVDWREIEVKDDGAGGFGLSFSGGARELLEEKGATSVDFRYSASPERVLATVVLLGPAPRS